ncbi:PEP-CTERM sorting domain-containing protein [Thiohalocapsa sp. ML1]|jgi:hypothetical protein|uniref:PEP-CTERM sorting domain-containing protein n=1 Tax=Thiohalocapsa sp. ML1 TaxID=1431688 RepID=UPI000732350D|nr:PEP-CTERM sorting domain-containing protein [Thiohalocapsa sp. ML1]
MRGLTGWFSAAALLAAALVAVPAQAALVGQYDGIDCGVSSSGTIGEFGSGADCVIPEDSVEGIKGPTPLIAKFEFAFDSSDGLSVTVGATFVGVVTRDHFQFTSTDGLTGTWRYDAGPTDPMLTAFAVNYGTVFDLYVVENGQQGDWETANGLGLRQLSFYDRGLSTTMAVPAPTPLVLLAAGAGFLLLARQRNRGVEGQRSLCAPG